MEFISHLRDRLEAQSESSSVSSFDLSHFKKSLEIIGKNSQKGANSLYASDAEFLKQSLKVIELLEPDENPILVLKSFTRFSSIEKSNDSSHSAEAFDKTRAYLSQDSSTDCDPSDLDEAANAVDHKIFRLQESQSL